MRCASTASRAISRCMISVEPSKIRLIRTSRSSCSAGTARSPRARQRVGGLVAPTAADLHQLVGDQPRHLARPQLRQRRLDPDVGARPRRPVAQDSSTHRLQRVRGGRDEGDLARPRPRARRPAGPTAPARPTTRGRSSATTSPVAEHMAGIDSRPVLSVVSAILSPSPSLPSRFSTGTRTWCSRVTPFSMPRSPMKALRRSTVMPGASPSTTNAVMPPRPPVVLRHPGHDDQQVGDDAVGGPQLHAVEQVGRAVVGERRGGRQPRRVRPDVGLGEQERRDRPGGAARQERAASAPACRTA